MTPIARTSKFAGLLLPAALFSASQWWSSSAAADIREPDNVYFGSVYVNDRPLTQDDGQYAVSVRLGNIELARYALGAVSQYGNQYVLRVPMDAVGARLPKTARGNDVVDFVLTDGLAEVVLRNQTLPERGALTRLDLGGSDVDGDGFEDRQDNCPDIANVSQVDRDGDGAGDACDAFPDNPRGTVDTDGDGMDDNWESAHGLIVGIDDSQDDPDGDGLTNLQEFLGNTDPRQPAAAPAVAVPIPAWVDASLSLALVLCGAGALRRGKRAS